RTQGSLPLAVVVVVVVIVDASPENLRIAAPDKDQGSRGEADRKLIILAASCEEVWFAFLVARRPLAKRNAILVAAVRQVLSRICGLRKDSVYNSLAANTWPVAWAANWSSTKQQQQPQQQQ
ncbi:unnamed protein product, partial [Polarella glacialis]